MTTHTIAHQEHELEEMRRNLMRREEELRVAKENQREEAARHKYENDPRIPIAIRLHEIQCHANHTDGCGWFYHHGKWDAWDRCQTHGLYLKKATKVVNKANELNITIDDVLAIIEQI